MVQFKLLGLNDPIPSGYRLATKQDVRSNMESVMQAMPGWEIANLADGSVDGKSYGGNVRDDIRNDVSHKLIVEDANCVSQPSTMRLFKINDPLPPGYRLATVADAHANPHELRAAMPGWEIANLADGSVDGASYGNRIKNEIRTDVSDKLAMKGNPCGPVSFQLFKLTAALPPYFRMATRAEVEANKPALLKAMPEWEIANLADGSVDGAKYGANVRPDQRNDVSDQLTLKVM